MAGTGTFASLYCVIFSTPSFRKSLKFFGTSITSGSRNRPTTGACGPPEKLSLALVSRLNVLRMIVKLVYLFSASKDEPHFQIRPTNLVAIQHIPSLLQCVILGVPTPQVTWKQDGQLIQNTPVRHVLSNGSLYFDAPINRSFAGQYVCTGNNSAGFISSAPVLFTIACKYCLKKHQTVF